MQISENHWHSTTLVGGQVLLSYALCTRLLCVTSFFEFIITTFGVFAEYENNILTDVFLPFF